MTVANLGIAVQSGEAKTAAVDLDKLAASAQRAETGVQGLAKASVATGQATQQIGLNSANLAAQLQDIAVSAQMGMSGLQVGLQQGTQIAAVLTQAGGLRSAGSAIAAAFASIISPVSLVTIGLTAMATIGIQAVGGIFSETEKATNALEDHAKWLDKVLTGYDDVADAVSKTMELAAMLPKGVVVSDLQKSLADQAKAAEELQRRIEGATKALQENADFVREIQRIGESVGSDGGDIMGLLRQIELVKNLGLSIKSTVPEIQAAMVAARDLYNTADDPALQDMAMQAYDLGQSLLEAERAAFATRQAISLLNNASQLDSAVAAAEKYAGALKDIIRLRPELRSERERASDALNSALGSGDAVQRLAAMKEYEKTIAALDEQDRRREAERNKRSATKDFDQWGNSVANFQKRIDQQQAEIDLFGKGTFEIERQRAKLDLLNEARQAGIKITPKITEQVETMATAYATATAELERMQYQQKQIDQLNGALASGFADLFIGIIDGSKSAEQGIADLLGSLGRLLINQAFQSLFAPVGVGGMGFNPFGMLFGGGRATGGPVEAGKVYRINENTPNSEFFAPAVSGTVIPAANDNGGAAPQITIHNTISVPPGTSADVAPAIAREVTKAMQAQLPDALERYNRNPARRYGTR